MSSTTKSAIPKSMPAVVAIWPTRLNHAVNQPQHGPPSSEDQWYMAPAVGIAEAISAIEAATSSVKTETSGQPIPLTAGPPNVRPWPNRTMAPVKIEMIVKETAKLAKPP